MNVPMSGRNIRAGLSDAVALEAWLTNAPEQARAHEMAIAAKVQKVPMPVRALCPISIGVGRSMAWEEFVDAR